MKNKIIEKIKNLRNRKDKDKEYDKKLAEIKKRDPFVYKNF